MGDEWQSTALFWLDHTRDSATMWLDGWLDHARAAPILSGLLAANLVLIALWARAAARTRRARQAMIAQEASLAELVALVEAERKWRLASANVDAQERRAKLAADDQRQAQARDATSLPIDAARPETVAAA